VTVGCSTGVWLAGSLQVLIRPAAANVGGGGKPSRMVMPLVLISGSLEQDCGHTSRKINTRVDGWHLT